LGKPIARLPGDRCDASLRGGDFVRPIENPQHDVIGAAFVVIQPDHLASLTGSAIAENMMRRRLDPERIVPGLKILPLIAARQISRPRRVSF
jgi:hypothetical protein